MGKPNGEVRQTDVERQTTHVALLGLMISLNKQPYDAWQWFRRNGQTKDSRKTDIQKTARERTDKRQPEKD